MSLTIICKKYDHFNRALGVQIKSKRHYDEVMKRRGFVSQEEGQRLVEKHNSAMVWKPSKDCIDVIKAIKHAADKKGNVVLGRHPKIVAAMEAKGMTFDIKKINKHLQEAGATANV